MEIAVTQRISGWEVFGEMARGGFVGFGEVFGGGEPAFDLFALGGEFGGRFVRVQLGMELGQFARGPK